MGVLAESDLCVLETPEAIVIEVRGTLDVFLAQRFLDAAMHCVESGLDTTLDCARLERIDASALQVLLALRRSLVARGHALRLTSVPKGVSEYLVLAGLWDLSGHRPEASSGPGAGEDLGSIG